MTVYAVRLKVQQGGTLQLPKRADVVKTATLKELALYVPDWHYIRLASLSREASVRAGTRVGSFTDVCGVGA